MDAESLKRLLDSVREGGTDVDDAIEHLSHMPFEHMGFATVDHHRSLRCGFPEVIFCPGKTVEQIREIFRSLAAAGDAVLATRATPEAYDAVATEVPTAKYDQLARTITFRRGAAPPPAGHIAIVAAGTSDLPVAQEARITAEIMDQHVTTHYDVGVAGLHRLLSHHEQLRSAKVLVVAAGMEGALASVVGGLVSAPVIAVPTSVGYGASFGGLAALLAMLNSCASNVAVVNIDNGFGAGYMAGIINRQAAGNGESRDQ